MDNRELNHHGIIGMKWGVRRYQNPDGTLTAKGKKRYSSEMNKLKEEEKVLKNKQRTQAKIDKLAKKRQEVDDLKKQLSGKTSKHDESTKPKSIKDMSDEELASRITRMRLEQTYASMLPKEVSAGEKFINSYLKPAGKKAADKLGDTILDKVNKYMREQFGLDVDKNEMAELEKAAKKASLEMTIRRNERDKKNEGTNKKSATHSDPKDPDNSDKNESFDGEVRGKSSSKSNSSSSKTNHRDPIYATFEDNDVFDSSPNSRSTTSYRSTGKSAVLDILSSPAGSYLLMSPKEDK